MARPRKPAPPPARKLPLQPSGARKTRRVRASVAAEGSATPWTVPTPWLKTMAGVLLLPVCWVASRTFFEAFAHATVRGRFWASEELYHFILGVLVWTLAFFLLPKMIRTYVFGHELTHALWVWAQGGRVSAFVVGRDGGYIIADRRDFLVSLAPYFFPLYSIVAILAFSAAGWFYPWLWLYQKYLFMAVGMTWAFHFTFTCWMIPKQQTDLLLHGTFFSLVVIYLANLLVLTTFFVVACPQATWRVLGHEFVRNAADFSYGLCQELGVHPARWFEHVGRRHR